MLAGANWSNIMTTYAGDINLMKAAQTDPNRQQALRNLIEAKKMPPPAKRKKKKDKGKK